MNWTHDDEATLAILLRRKEQAQQQRRARLEEVAEAMVTGYGYPANGEAEAGITRRWIAQAIDASAADICAIYVAQPAQQRDKYRSASWRELPTNVYRNGSTSMPYTTMVYVKALKKMKYVGKYASVAEAVAARDEAKARLNAAS